jgi:hydrogenase maturation protein HypF
MEDMTIKGLGITLYGLVQGIGFRPYVARIAQQWHISGSVINDGGAVSIKAFAPSCVLEGFLKALLENLPENAQVVHARTYPLEDGDAGGGFVILESGEQEDQLVILPPDLPVCERCLAEMKDPANRRYRHPFISCTHCGPRYSIMRAFPYDRHTTSMAGFSLCPACETEYRRLEDRRFHAQTVSCMACGPYLRLEIPHNAAADNHAPTSPGEVGNASTHAYERNGALDKAIEILKNNGILAVKGIGGYHLITSPWSDQAVSNLRLMKAREQKPFAVCFPDMSSIHAHCAVSREEQALLGSKARPIVLLEKRDSEEEALSPLVGMSSRYQGAFLPYTPILHLLTEALGPLVATSANLTESPVIYQDEEIRAFTSPYLCGILTHDREIVTGQDDSVAWVINNAPQLIRRARGYTPLSVYMPSHERASGTVFAAGGQLKSAFCFAKGPFAYISQYMGDLDTEASFMTYRRNYTHMAELLRMKPELAVCDLHPDYLSTAFARELGIALVKVQHHHAHTAAVMAENGLQGPVIGVSFDGTGYGDDGAIWGGEFLICEKEHYTRAGHLKYVNMLMGDESMKDAGKTALCYLAGMDCGNVIGDDRYETVRAAIRARVNTLPSSSMGRLFDAVSALLGISCYNRYEGESAILLENAAALAKKKSDAGLNPGFDIHLEDGMHIMDPEGSLRSLIAAREQGTAPDILALAFHRAVIEGTAEVCHRLKHQTGISQVALSGGVFQNRIIAEGLHKRLMSMGFTVYSGKMAPPNDSGICLGQAANGMEILKSRAL